MNNLKKILAHLGIAALVVFAGNLLVVPHATAQSDAQSAVCEALGVATNENGCAEDEQSGINAALRTALNLLSLLAGVIAVIMIIIAGLKFITSQGDANSISSARNSIIYAVIGIIIVLLSQVIVQFVLSETQQQPETTVPAGGNNPGGGGISPRPE